MRCKSKIIQPNCSIAPLSWSPHNWLSFLYQGYLTWISSAIWRSCKNLEHKLFTYILWILKTCFEMWNKWQNWYHRRRQFWANATMLLLECMIVIAVILNMLYIYSIQFISYISLFYIPWWFFYHFLCILL